MANQYWIRCFDVQGQELQEFDAGRSQRSADGAFDVLTRIRPNRIPTGTAEIRVYRNHEMIRMAARAEAV